MKRRPSITHWVQYHNPDVMDLGLDEVVGPPFSIVTSRRCDDPRGDKVFLVGRIDQADSPVYQGYWFEVNEVLPSPIPEFLFEFVGNEGFLFEPMPIISDKPWYGQLLGMTHNFHDGLTAIRIAAVLEGLLAVAEQAGR